MRTGKVTLWKGGSKSYSLKVKERVVALSRGEVTGSLKRYLVLVFIFLFTHSFAQDLESDSSRRDIFDLSFEELMDVKINTGTLSGIRKHNVPVALTIISENDIRHSPARNILDLLETYVPGALYMNHIEGPHPGIRGIIADRNYKVLLLVNGKVLNQKARNGASTEIENWDMNDIEEIEIIRGPGSVTYGPGAIMGVINIKTKNAATAPGLEVKSHYLSNYKSVNTSLSYGVKTPGLDFYCYGSLTRTPGFSPRAYAIDMTTYESGYVGTSDFSAASVKRKPVQRYFSDFDDNPQVKAYVQLDFGRNWQVWARYTRAGSTVGGTFSQSRPQLGFTIDSVQVNGDGKLTYFRSPLYGDYEELFAIDHQQFSTSIEKDHAVTMLGLPNEVHIKTSLGYYNYSGSKGNSDFASYPFETPLDLRTEYADRYNALNQTYNFSESELIGTVLMKTSVGSSKLAVGSSYAYNYFGPAWGSKFIKLQNLNPYLVDQDHLTLHIEHGWSTATYSVFGELNTKLAPWMTILASVRSDKNTYSRLLFSPRIALVSELNQRNVLKLVLQQSRRMNNGEELHGQKHSGVRSNPESLTGVELIYSKVQSKWLLFNMSAFYNHLGVISWSGTESLAKFTGNLKLAGIEAEAKFVKDGVTVGLNHAFTKQLQWVKAEDVFVSGVSYSDFHLEFKDGAFTGHGNDLNNWANNATKMFMRFGIFKNRLVMHNDLRVYWRFEGAQDGLAMIDDGIRGTAVEGEVQRLLDDIYSKNVYQADFRLNSSATLEVNSRISLTAFVQNLLSVNNAKRYSYDAGVVMQGPARVAYVEEPRSFGLKLNVSL